MLKQILQRFLNLFNTPQAKDLARKQVEEFRRQLLVHHTSTIYHTKMAEYCNESITRLSKYQ